MILGNFVYAVEWFRRRPLSVAPQRRNDWTKDMVIGMWLAMSRANIMTISTWPRTARRRHPAAPQ